MQISSSLKKEREVIEIMSSSDDESVDIVSPIDGVVQIEKNADEEASLPLPNTGVCRPTQSNGDGGTGGNTSVGVENPWCVIFRGSACPDGRDRMDDGGLTDEIVWKYQGK